MKCRLKYQGADSNVPRVSLDRTEAAVDGNTHTEIATKDGSTNPAVYLRRIKR